MQTAGKIGILVLVILLIMTLAFEITREHPAGPGGTFKRFTPESAEPLTPEDRARLDEFQQFVDNWQAWLESQNYPLDIVWTPRAQQSTLCGVVRNGAFLGLMCWISGFTASLVPDYDGFMQNVRAMPEWKIKFYVMAIIIILSSGIGLLSMYLYYGEWDDY